MAKRFIDTGLFDDEWFLELKLQPKIFWIYYITKCDHAGFLKYNKRLIEFQTGIKDLDETIKDFTNRIVRVKEQLLFSPKFIQFQYPNFPNCNFKAAISAMELMKKNGIDLNSYLTVSEELPNSYGNGIGNGISISIPENTNTDITPIENLTSKAYDQYKELQETFADSNAADIYTKLKEFITEHRPSFPGPYADMWNLVADKYGFSKVSHISTERASKLKTRVTESRFDFPEILNQIRKSAFYRGEQGTWKVNFDYVIKNDNNYLKILDNAS